MKRLILKNKFKEEIAKDKEAIAVFVFGSFARGEPNRDIDLAIVLDKKYSNIEMSRKRLKYSSILPSKFDVQIFQQLPIYIRKRILKEGKIILSKNEPLLYEIAFATIKEFGLYEKIYTNYLESIK